MFQVKKIVLTVLAALIISGCGGSGDDKPKQENKKTLDDNALKVVSLVSNVDENSVFRINDYGYHHISKSMGNIDSSKLEIFDGLNGYVRSINVVSENIFLSSVYSNDDYKMRNMITYNNNGDRVTYELDTASSLVEYYQVNLVGDAVVILGDKKFYYVKDGKRYSINEEDVLNSYRTDGKHIAYISHNSDLNVMTLDEKVKIKSDGKGASLLAVDDGNVILAMTDDFKCHPIDYGIQSDIYGNYILKNCELYDTSKPERKGFSQVYHMKPIVRFNIDSEEYEPWVWITVFGDTESKVISYSEGHVFFNKIKQDIRTQNAGNLGYYKEYKGKNIPLVEMSNFCSGFEETYMYADDPVGIVKRNNSNVYCFENSYLENNGTVKNNGIKFTVNYLDASGDYVNDGHRELSLRKYNIEQRTDVNSIMVSNEKFTFAYHENRFTFDPEANIMEKFDLDEGAVFIKSMQKSETIHHYEQSDNRPKRKTPF